MKYTITLLTIFLFSFVPKPEDSCDNAYQSATYAYQHLKKSLTWTSIDGLKLSAKKAISAMKKVQSSTEICGCKDAYNLSYDALEKLKKSLEKEEFESSRYLLSKANVDAKEVLLLLDACRDDPMYDLKSEEKSLVQQEQALLEQQQRLLEEQKKLENRILEQQQRQQQIAEQKASKLVAQKDLKAKAESNLKQLESLITELAENMDCQQDFSPPKDYIRSIDELEIESLEATQAFYITKAREIAYTLLNNLETCQVKE